MLNLKMKCKGEAKSPFFLSKRGRDDEGGKNRF